MPPPESFANLRSCLATFVFGFATFAVEFATFGSPTIVEVIVATGGQRAVVDASMIFPTDIAAHRLGDVYVAGMGGVLGIDPVTSAVRLVTSGGFLGFVNDLTLDPVTGDLYTLGLVGTETALIRIDPTLGSQLPVAVGGLLQTTAMNGLEMNSSGEAFVLATIGLTQSVIRVDVTTGAQTLLPSPGGIYPLLRPMCRPAVLARLISNANGDRQSS